VAEAKLRSRSVLVMLVPITSPRSEIPAFAPLDMGHSPGMGISIQMDCEMENTQLFWLHPATRSAGGSFRVWARTPYYDNTRM